VQTAIALKKISDHQLQIEGSTIIKQVQIFEYHQHLSEELGCGGVAKYGRKQPTVGSSLGLAKSSEIYLCFFLFSRV
jgi:hypothetical protein